jgi:transcriptional/translational regulatory protein YebC/TACO1
MDYLICCQSCQHLHSTDSIKYNFELDGILKVSFQHCPYCGSRDGVIMRGLMADLELAKQLINESLKVISESSPEELKALNDALKETNQEIMLSKVALISLGFQNLLDKNAVIIGIICTALSIASSYHNTWISINQNESLKCLPEIQQIHFSDK